MALSVAIKNRIRKSTSYKTDFFHGTGIEICFGIFLQKRRVIQNAILKTHRK
jgi:hypothetical protein